jgi:hypothetical protein
MPENGAESPPSSARFVGQPYGMQDSPTERKHYRRLIGFYTQLNSWQLPNTDLIKNVGDKSDVT